MLSTVKKIIKYTLLFYITLYASVWALSPMVIQYFLSDYLEQQELVLSDASSIRYNPFTSHLEIQQLSISKRDAVDSKVFSLESLELEMRFYELLFDQVYVSEFIIDGLYLNVKKLGKDFEVAGVMVPLSQEGGTEDSANNQTSEPATISNEESENSFPYKLDILAALLVLLPLLILFIRRKKKRH